jgi:hypothetical protein
MPDTAPHIQQLEATIPAQGTANAAQDQVVGEAPFAGTVTSVSITPEAAVTAHGTNYRTFRLVNKGAAGSGSTVVASFATDTVTTDDLVAFDEKELTLSGTAANLVVAAGDVLAADETVAAGGVAHGGYQMRVTLSRGT